jgi:hypothetical protein
MRQCKIQTNSYNKNMPEGRECGISGGKAKIAYYNIWLVSAIVIN